MVDNNSDSAKPTATARQGANTEGASAEDLDYDPMDQVTPVRRVEAVGSSIVAMHREYPEPKHDARGKREGVALVLKPWSPNAKQNQMHTMSDLTDMAKAARPSDVAKVRSRHISADQARAARTGADKPEAS